MVTAGYGYPGCGRRIVSLMHRTWLLGGALGFALIAGTACGSEHAATPTAALATSANVKATAANEDGCVSLEEFDSVKTGMGAPDVITILGENGKEISESDLAGTKTMMYEWAGCGGLGANMNAMFQDGMLIQKAQFGLQADGKPVVMPTTTTTTPAPTSAQILADPAKLERAVSSVASGDCQSLRTSLDVATDMATNGTESADRTLGELYEQAAASRRSELGCG
jgi:hypothetical protein